MASDREPFIRGQIESLQAFDFVVVAAPAVPFAALEVSRQEDGQLLVELARRPPDAALGAEQLAALERLGFARAGEGWKLSRTVMEAEASVLVESVLRDVYTAGDGAPVDLSHGSRRAEHEASLKLDALRRRIEPVLEEVLGAKPERDGDGDYLFTWDSTQVFVAPRAMAGMPVVIRVFAITNVGVTITPELGLFLARLNFGLVFGRFALDTDHQAIWFSETLLGEQVSDEEIRFTVRMVAETANEWDDRLAQMFGGTTHAMLSVPEQAQRVSTKPGQGGYL